ncbi:hypothetical protein SAMN04489844_1652 [Nocardioides exalbidus]|uniref:Uncharacterized protein n=1 Tax=Nocardioides exalbidus TaxID=402596 RepID=A0A1H4PNG8_9ACTN|nr:DUF5691 domain-containing protein [Nocardioides exalbidus]SEC08742.1 hypothetical protein SAMN04489844_1652 [Nocardioides exalbidus]
MSGLEQWLADVATTALVGTARRDAPGAPAELGVRPAADAPAEHRLLDGAALVDALARAGARLPDALPATEVAPPEDLPVCSDTAAQLLHLLLTQPPVTKATRDDLVVEWLRLATAAGQRAPSWLLPGLLAFAAGRRHVARALGTAPGERGAWLAALNPDWASLLLDDDSLALAGVADDWVEVWPTLPTAQAVPAFEAGRRADPAAARELLASEWDGLSAKVRSEALQALRSGLSLDDEPLLERALDDKAKSVRDVAVRMLDRLPGSARGARMAERLRGLVRVKGTLVRHLEVDVPDAPDQAGVRDGLTAPGRGATVPPTTWLAQVVHAAPLETWTDLTGRAPAATLKMVRDKDVLTWLVDVVLARRDREWAAALVDQGRPDARLLALLPDETRSALLGTWVLRPPQGLDLPALLNAAPRPWPDDLARTVLRAIQGQGSTSRLALVAGPMLASALPPSSAPEVRAALDRVPEDATYLRRALTETLQLHAFRTSLTEAFR